MIDTKPAVSVSHDLTSFNLFLLDQVRARLSFTETIKAIERMCQRWPNTRKKLIEDSANGPAIIDTLQRKIPGLMPIRAKDSKVARARSVSCFIEAGNIFLPHPHIAPKITPLTPTIAQSGEAIADLDRQASLGRLSQIEFEFVF